MKKLLLLPVLAVLIFSCCNDDCVAQIPPIPAYVDSACVAIMPNVIPKLIISDNCELSSIIQMPLAGTVIAPPLVGTVSASDASGNITTVSFQVVKMDTIAPVITWDENAPIGLKEGFDEAAEHYTKWLAWANYEQDRIFHIPEFRPDGDKVWYNTIVLDE